MRTLRHCLPLLSVLLGATACVPMPSEPYVDTQLATHSSTRVAVTPAGRDSISRNFLNQGLGLYIKHDTLDGFAMYNAAIAIYQGADVYTATVGGRTYALFSVITDDPVTGISTASVAGVTTGGDAVTGYATYRTGTPALSVPLSMNGTVRSSTGAFAFAAVAPFGAGPWAARSGTFSVMPLTRGANCTDFSPSPRQSRCNVGTFSATVVLTDVESRLSGRDAASGTPASFSMSNVVTGGYSESRDTSPIVIEVHVGS